MEIIFNFFESFSLTSEPMLILLPFIILAYYGFSYLGYKEHFLVVVGLLFFWAITQFSILAVFLIVLLSLVNFYLLRLYQKNSMRIVRYVAFTINLLALVSLKYLSDTVNILNSFSSFAGFVGISFYVFHVWSIYMDIYNQKIFRRIELFTFLSYLLYFPKIITGPLVRYNEFEKELTKYEINENVIMAGVGLFIYGMVIKAVADYIALYPMNIYSNPQGYSGFEHLCAMYGYALYIFLDFSSYTNIARGISKLFGIELPKNFISPYRAISMVDFWRRWHITLSYWIRDYIYIPLGGSKYGTIRMHLNLFVAFFLSGIWHGVGLNYAIWGIVHGFGIVINKIFSSMKISLPLFIAWLLTFHWVCFGWIFFANPIDEALLSIQKILFDFDGEQMALVIYNNLMWFIIVVIAFLFSLWEDFLMELWIRFFTWVQYFIKIVLVTILLYVILLAHQGNVSTFIYQNF